MRILVTHPGRQHAHQLVSALHEKGALAGYWTGVPSVDPAEKGVLYRSLARLSPQPTMGLPAARVRHQYVAPLVRRVAERLCSPAQAHAWAHRGEAWFDRWAAARLPTKIDAVVCYENGALETFRRAKRHGIITILDAASFHYSWQDEVYEPVESDAVHAAINARKDREISLADHVLTVSELARESYVDSGVSEEAVTSVPMGADLSDFRPPDPLREADDDPFTFLFAGHVGERKGADVLLDASRRLCRDDVSHRVQFAGAAEPGTFSDAPPSVEPLGYLETGQLVRAFQNADVLVLPSRHDSFGRTVVEGMATGLPALVSDHVGAKEMIVEGENGWVVPGEDADALADRMRWCVEHPTAVTDMQTAAIEAARSYTWDAYRERVTSVLEEVIQPQEAVPAGVETGRAEEPTADASAERRDTSTPAVGRSAVRSRTRLALFTTHPIQYQVPWFRALAELPEVDLTVYYDRIPDAEEQGEGFGTAFTWDIPLLDGYDWRVLDERAASEQRFRALHEAVAPAWTDVALVTGWHDRYLQRATLTANLFGTPLIVRGESGAHRPRSLPIRGLHRLYLSLFDAYLTIGKNNRAFYRQYGIEDERLFPNRYFVENERFERDYRERRNRRGDLQTAFGIPDGTTCFLFVGKFTEQKHTIDLLRATQNLSEEDISVLLVGDGPERDRLERFAEAEDLPVTFTGFLNQSEIGDAYTAADVLVLPSDYETWGLVVNEAMIFECPAIVSDRVGCGPDLVEEGETGYTFPFGDTDVLPDRMERMVASPARRREMGENARKRVMSDYTVEKAVEGTIRALQSVVQRDA